MVFVMPIWPNKNKKQAMVKGEKKGECDAAVSAGDLVKLTDPMKKIRWPRPDSVLYLQVSGLQS